MERNKFYICKKCGTVNFRPSKGFNDDDCHCEKCNRIQEAKSVEADLDEKTLVRNNIRFISNPISNFSNCEIIFEIFDLEISFKKSKRPIAKLDEASRTYNEDVAAILTEHNTPKKSNVRIYSFKWESDSNNDIKLILLKNEKELKNAEYRLELFLNMFNKTEIIEGDFVKKVDRGSIISTIKEIATNPHIEILMKAGYVNMDFNDGRLKKGGKSPHEILNIPKDKCKFIRDIQDESKKNEPEMQALRSFANYSTYWDLFRDEENKNLDLTVFKKALIKVYQNCSNISVTSGVQHPYFKYYYNESNKPDLFMIKDLFKAAKKHNVVFDVLIEYLTKKVREDQGLASAHTAFKIYMDIIAIVDDLNLELDKYPKSLITTFDRLNYLKAIKYDEICKQKFLKKVTEYGVFKYKNDKYIITTPMCPDDMKREGDNLGNCVANYVSDVMNGDSRIFFMRNVSEPDKSLVAIELNMKNQIRQKYGYRNRYLSDDEEEFVKEWMKFVKEKEAEIAAAKAKPEKTEFKSAV